MKITLSKKTAKDLGKAIHFFYVSNTKATAENKDGIKELSPERMKLLKMTPEGLDRLVGVAINIKKNTEVKKKVTVKN